MHDVDQVRGTSDLLRILLMCGINDVMADMVLEKLGRRQSIHGTFRRCHEYRHVGAAEFGIARTLDRLDLSLDAPNWADELGFGVDGL
jgi:hypothetical protein